MQKIEGITQLGKSFWNIRGSFKLLIGMIDIGTHMSVIGLPSGKFLVVDTIPLTTEIRSFIDDLTDNGSKIEAVIATHPFHSLSFPDFHKIYNKCDYYGTPRHLKNLGQIPWKGSIADCATRQLWNPDVQMRIPNGSEFIDPKPEKTNHFNSVWVYHPESKTIHVDDTVMAINSPGIILSIAGYKEGSMFFHPSIKGPGLKPTPEAPFQFKDWVVEVLTDWDFDNMCTAHTGNKIGGAKQQLQQLLEETGPLFDQLSKKNLENQSKCGGIEHKDDKDEHNLTVSGNECG